MNADAPQPCLICWSDDGAGLRSLFLKRSYRHCFAVIHQDGRHLVMLDVGRFGLRIRYLGDRPMPTADIAAHFRRQRYVVVETTARTNTGIGGFGLVTCVGLIKRLVGIRARWVVTPYQLWKELSHDQKSRS